VHKPFECVGEYYEAAESLVSIVDDEDWRGLPLVEEFRARRAELKGVAATADTSPDVHYVPAQYASTLDDRDGAVPKS
jgi:hypothetical protein